MTNILRAAEKSYYLNKFDLAKGNIIKTWNILKGLIKSDYSPTENISEINSGGTVITNKQTIADTFNEYFVNVGPNLAAKIPSVQGDFLSYINGNFSGSMVVHTTDANEITNIVSQLSTSASTGCDDIPAKIVKAVLPVIVEELVILFSKSLANGIFP